jgi:hypothetical protein
LLVIRAEQMSAFEAALREQLEKRLLARLAREYSWSSEELRALIRRGVHKAEQYGIVGEQEVAALLGWMVEEGEHFDTDPQRPVAREILADGDLPEAVKVRMLAHWRPWRKPEPDPLVED